MQNKSERYQEQDYIDKHVFLASLTHGNDKFINEVNFLGCCANQPIRLCVIGSWSLVLCLLRNDASKELKSLQYCKFTSLRVSGCVEGRHVTTTTTLYTYKPLIALLSQRYQKEELLRELHGTKTPPGYFTIMSRPCT